MHPEPRPIDALLMFAEQVALAVAALAASRGLEVFEHRLVLDKNTEEHGSFIVNLEFWPAN